MSGRFENREDVLRQANIAIDNLRSDQELAGPMAEAGCGPAFVDRIEAQKQLVETKILEYDRENREKTEASRERQAARDDLLSLLRMDRKLLRIRYRDEPGKLQQLGVDEELSRTYGELPRQGRKIYDTIMGSAQLQAEVADRGLTQEKLVQRLAAVVRHEKADSAYNREAPQAHRAFEELEAEVAVLAGMLRDVLDTADAIFPDDPRQRQKLGLA